MATYRQPMTSHRRANKITVSIAGWLLCLGVGSFLIGGPLTVVLPFEPYRLLDYQIEPSVVCPAKPVKFTYASDIVSQPLARIQVGDPNQAGDEAMNTRAQWVKMKRLPDGTMVEAGKRLEPENYPSDFNGNYGERSRESNFQRYAPNEPGLWRQDITIFVRGRQALREVTQIVPTFSTDPVRVKEFSQCR